MQENRCVTKQKSRANTHSLVLDLELCQVSALPAALHLPTFLQLQFVGSSHRNNGCKDTQHLHSISNNGTKSPKKNRQFAAACQSWKSNVTLYFFVLFHCFSFTCDCCGCLFLQLLVLLRQQCCHLLLMLLLKIVDLLLVLFLQRRESRLWRKVCLKVVACELLP